MTQGSRSGQDDAHDHHDRGEGHGTQRVIRQSIQHLGSSQDMETNQQDVVSQQHEAGKDVCRLAFAEDIVAKVTWFRGRQTCVSLDNPSQGGMREMERERESGVPTNVLDLRVLHDVLVHGEGSDPEESAGHNHGNDAGYPSQYAEGDPMMMVSSRANR